MDICNYTEHRVAYSHWVDFQHKLRRLTGACSIVGYPEFRLSFPEYDAVIGIRYVEPESLFQLTGLICLVENAYGACMLDCRSAKRHTCVCICVCVIVCTMYTASGKILK